MIFFNCLTRKLKDYFSLVAGITLIVGLLLKIPNRGYPVEFKPLNPLVVVDLNRFDQNTKTLKLTSVNRGTIIRDLGLKDVPINSAQHFICFFRETYYKIQDTNRNDQDITNTEITRADFQEDFERGILKQVKTSLGYNDADTSRQTNGYSYNNRSNIVPLPVLMQAPSSLSSHLLRFSGFPKETMGVYFFRPHDPFFSIFEKAATRSEKIQLYRALENATTFYSSFSLENISHIPQSGIEVILNLQWPTDKLLEKVAENYNLIIKPSGETLRSIHTPTILPGELNYKLIVIAAPHPFPANEINLETRNLLVEIGYYWKYVLLLPFFLLLIPHILGTVFPTQITAENASNIPTQGIMAHRAASLAAFKRRNSGV